MLPFNQTRANELSLGQTFAKGASFEDLRVDGAQLAQDWLKRPAVAPD
jgi:hypothetical protein